jgi:uncharacterized protein (DUF885 family)
VVVKPEESLYYGPVRDMPAEFAAADRERLAAAYRAAITVKIVPSYRKLLGYMRDEYLPKCRLTVGLDALPDGAALVRVQGSRDHDHRLHARADP